MLIDATWPFFSVCLLSRFPAPFSSVSVCADREEHPAWPFVTSTWLVRSVRGSVLSRPVVGRMREADTQVRGPPRSSRFPLRASSRFDPPTLRDHADLPNGSSDLLGSDAAFGRSWPTAKQIGDLWIEEANAFLSRRRLHAEYRCLLIRFCPSPLVIFPPNEPHSESLRFRRGLVNRHYSRLPRSPLPELENREHSKIGTSLKKRLINSDANTVKYT